MLVRLERIEKYVHNKEKYNSFEDLNNISSSNYNYNVFVVFMLFHMALRFHAVFYTKTYTHNSLPFSAEINTNTVKHQQQADYWLSYLFHICLHNSSKHFLP